MGTHYDVLGLHRTATSREIEDQYRALVKVVHPDVGGDAITFTFLTEAYEVLADPVRRAEYDRSLASAAAPPQASAPPEPRPPFSLRPSTAIERERAAGLARRGIRSWHQTPGEYVAAGCRRELWSKGLVISIMLVAIAVWAIIMAARG